VFDKRKTLPKDNNVIQVDAIKSKDEESGLDFNIDAYLK
jgi:hypothetical protein